MKLYVWRAGAGRRTAQTSGLTCQAAKPLYSEAIQQLSKEETKKKKSNMPELGGGRAYL